MRIVLLCLALVFVACASEEQAQISPSPSGGSKPSVEVPGGEPPGELVTEDIVEGKGTEAKAGDVVTVHYVGVSWSTQEEFDSSWGTGQAATFPLDGVIPGWQQGIPGMKEGGRRRLVIPPDLAYGANPPPGSGIAPNETLVFVVDLVKVGGS